MDIINSDYNKGTVKLKINNPEDIWYLSNLIDPGDFVKGKTTRKIKIGSGENVTVDKKTYILKIEAENIELGEEVDTLRINGKIKEGPDEVSLGSYQAITLKEKSEFVLEKVKWLDYQKEKLKEATEKKYNYLICLFDREEALFALTKNFGFKILVKIHGEVHKKSQKVEVKKDFHQEIIQALDIYSGRYNPESIIVASPAFFKEELVKKITIQELKDKIVTAVCSEVSENALDEVIKRPELADTLKSSQTRKETLAMEELLNEISKDKLAVYGIKDVQKAVEAGAISKLLIADGFIKEKKVSGEYEILDSLMKQIEKLKGKIQIISSDNENGKKLTGLGGIAAILRYKLW